MPATPHSEKHFTASDTVRNIVIGMSDGHTVPFALAAGLSGTSAATKAEEEIRAILEHLEAQNEALVEIHRQLALLMEERGGA